MNICKRKFSVFYTARYWEGEYPEKEPGIIKKTKNPPQENLC